MYKNESWYWNIFDCVYPYPYDCYDDSQKICGRTPVVVTKYQKRSSGPLLDRIHIHIEAPGVDQEKLCSNRRGEIQQFC